MPDNVKQWYENEVVKEAADKEQQEYEDQYGDDKDVYDHHVLVFELLDRDYHAVDVEQFDFDDAAKEAERLSLKWVKCWCMMTAISVGEMTTDDFEDLVAYKSERAQHVKTYYANKIGFDPDKHVFRCHKCHGILIGGRDRNKNNYCGCISGYVRENYKYEDIEQGQD